MARRTVRERVLARLKRRLAQRGSPRLEMALIVCATGAAGFLCSAAMLLAGVRSMALRYPLAVGCAYGAFFFFVWIWLRAKRGSPGTGLDLDVDPLDLLEAAVHVPSGGASASAEGGEASLGDLDVDADESVVVLVVLAAIVASVFAVGYLIATAPVFFAEVLLDGVLSYGLYRRLRGLDRRNWLESAVSRTAIPFVIVAVFFAMAGAVMQNVVPEGDSIGDVWEHIRNAD